MRFILFLIIISSILLGTCNGKFFKVTPEVNLKTQEICFEEFGVLYSDYYKIPLVSFEKIDKNKVQEAKMIKRKNMFHAEPLISSEMVFPSDYYKSGFDRGHLTPSADMPTKKSQYESFSMVNIIPQYHKNNSGVWLKLETFVRDTAQKHTVYVVSGVIIIGTEQRLNNKVLIPLLLYKALYIEDLNKTKIFIVNNKNDSKITNIDLDSFISMFGFSPFPKENKNEL